MIIEVEPDEQEVTQRCDAFLIGSHALILNYCSEEAVNLHFYRRFSLPSSALFLRPRTPSASKCIWPQFSSAQDESVCVCVCVSTLTSDWFELRTIFTQSGWPFNYGVPRKTSCDLHAGCFACRSQSSVLPFLCSPITNKPLSEYISGYSASTWCFTASCLNDSRPIAANVTRISMSDGSASANQKWAHWWLTWAEITHNIMVKIW